MKNRNTSQCSDVPPLFDPDSGRNLSAWVQKCFPETPTMQPGEAIRLWLGKNSNGKPGRMTTAGTPIHRVASDRYQPPSNINLSGDRRSDDRLTFTLQNIAE